MGCCSRSAPVARWNCMGAGSGRRHRREPGPAMSCEGPLSGGPSLSQALNAVPTLLVTDDDRSEPLLVPLPHEGAARCAHDCLERGMRNEIRDLRPLALPRIAAGGPPCGVLTLGYPRAVGSMSKAQLDAMVEEATVDCYNEAEQVTGLLTVIEDELTVPFKTRVLGVEVTVERVDLTGEDQIVAICSREKLRQAIPLLDLPLPTPPPEGAQWIEAYRHWLG